MEVLVELLECKCAVVVAEVLAVDNMVLLAVSLVEDSSSLVEVEVTVAGHNHIFNPLYKW